ncbi:MAG: hypothetical protein ACK5PS_00865 [Desulfopila sp.]
MIIHNSTEPYTRPTVSIGGPQQFTRRQAWDFPGGAVLWKGIGRAAAMIGGVTVVVSMLLGSYGSGLTAKVTLLEEQRHQLVDRNIVLRATRAGMLTRQAVEAAAGKELSLYKPEDGQRFRYNRSKGRFDKF